MISKLQVWRAFLGDQIVALPGKHAEEEGFSWVSDETICHMLHQKQMASQSHIFIITSDSERLNQQTSDKSGSSWAAMLLQLTLFSWGQSLKDISAIVWQLHTEKEEATLYTLTLKKIKNAFLYFSDVRILIKSCNILSIFFPINSVTVFNFILHEKEIISMTEIKSFVSSKCHFSMLADCHPNTFPWSTQRTAKCSWTGWHRLF